MKDDIIRFVLNSRVRDIPIGMYIRFVYDKYIVRIDFDEGSEITVREANWDSEVTIRNPDLDTPIINVIEDARRLIEKYQAKLKKEGSGETRA